VNATATKPNVAARLFEDRKLARVDLLAFMKRVWWMPGPLQIGVHTRAIANRLTRAVDDYRQGKSTFLIIQVPFRHGKSDMVSRALPAWFLGRCHDLGPDVIMTGYGALLVESFSRRVKAIIGDERYQMVFPKTQVSATKSAVGQWAVADSPGEVVATGLGGSITGRGGNLIVIDDYCKRREEAESEAYRRHMWDAFTNEVMTRRAPASVVVVCATPWHVDDVNGRIRKEMTDNPSFPRFEFMTFPAESKEYESGYLFPERFEPDWYKTQRATLGAYSAAGLLDCEPTVRGGNLFEVESVQWHDDAKDFPDCRYGRFWDLASSTKERAKDDPDYTAGVLLGVVKQEGGAYEVWVKDVVAMQAEAPARDRRIRATADTDGSTVAVYVESVAGYKDAYTGLAHVLRGQRRVEKVIVHGDKVVRASPLEPVFESGNVHCLRGNWNALFMGQFSDFPSGKHDDVVDAVSGAYNALVRLLNRGRIIAH